MQNIIDEFKRSSSKKGVVKNYPWNQRLKWKQHIVKKKKHKLRNPHREIQKVNDTSYAEERYSDTDTPMDAGQITDDNDADYTVTNEQIKHAEDDDEEYETDTGKQDTNTEGSYQKKTQAPSRK